MRRAHRMWDTKGEGATGERRRLRGDIENSLWAGRALREEGSPPGPDGSEAVLREAGRKDRGGGRTLGRRGAARDDPEGGDGGNIEESLLQGLSATVGGGSPQGRLTRRTGRRPRCPRAPPRPGAARLPCSRGHGPRRGCSAISERTLCRSLAQPPLPPGEAARRRWWHPLGSTDSGPSSRATWVPGNQAALRSAGPSRGLRDGGWTPRPRKRTPSSSRDGTAGRASGTATR